MKNKNRIITGTIYFVLGILVAAGPHTIFAVCEAMEDKFMKCHWTAQGETGVGIAVAVLGVVLFLSASDKVRIGVQISLFTLLALVALLPDILIGVCTSEHMQCRSLTLPALNVLAVLGIVIGVINIFYLTKKKG